MNQMLTTALQELERTWQAAGDDITSPALGPGASAERIDEVWADLPWPLHPDARTWWQWREGRDPSGQGPRIGGSTLQFVTVELARELYDLRIRLALETFGKQAEAMTDEWYEGAWHPAFVPIASSESSRLLTLDCRAQGVPAPVRALRSDADVDDDPHAESLLDVLDLWQSCYRSKIFSWMPEIRSWDIEWDHGLSYPARAFL